jgi:hypothetical protein
MLVIMPKYIKDDESRTQIISKYWWALGAHIFFSTMKL